MKHRRGPFAPVVALLAILALMSLLVTAQSNIILRGTNISVTPPPPGACAEATAFFGRAGTLDTAHHDGINSAICHLVTSGTWAKLNALWITGTQTATAANQNLVSSSFTLLPNGSPNFTADQGYLGQEGSSTVFLNTQLNPSSVGAPYALNSASFGVWSFTNTQSSGAIGLSIDPNLVMILPRFTDDHTYAFLNNANSTAANAVATDSTGLFSAVRTTSSDVLVYRNSANISNATASPSTTIPNGNIYLLGENNNGSASQGAGYRMGAAFVGGGLTVDDVANLYNFICTDYFIPVRGSCL